MYFPRKKKLLATETYGSIYDKNLLLFARYFAIFSIVFPVFAHGWRSLP